MIDVDLVDRWFEAGYESGTLIAFSLFDGRVLVPLSQVADMVAERSGEAIICDDIRQFARDGWLRLQPRGESEGDVGAPLYVIERILIFMELRREGWGNAELADYAEYEDAMVAAFAVDDETFPYLDNDLEQLIQHFTVRIEALGRGEMRDAEGNLVDRSDELADARKELAFLEQLKVAGVPPEMDRIIAKHAFRIRANDELMRIMVVEGWRSQLRAGFTMDVEFEWFGSSAAEDGECVFEHGELDWPSTVQSVYGASQGQEGSEPIIRAPGFMLCGDRVTPTTTVRPREYERLWNEADIDAYLAARAEVLGRPMCRNCYARLPEPTRKHARFCSQSCRDAAKARRYRKRNPESAKRAQVKYRTSIADDE